MMPNMNFSNAMSSYAAQNIGARKMDRVKQGYKASMFMVVVFSLIITSIIFLFGPQLLGLFLKQGAEGSAMSYGLSYMKHIDGSPVRKQWSAAGSRRHGGVYAQLSGKPVLPRGHCLPAGAFHRSQRHMVVHTYRMGCGSIVLLPARKEREVDGQETGGLKTGSAAYIV